VSWIQILALWLLFGMSIPVDAVFVQKEYDELTLMDLSIAFLLVFVGPFALMLTMYILIKGKVDFDSVAWKRRKGR
jgi:hypothetical protein